MNHEKTEEKMTALFSTGFLKKLLTRHPLPYSPSGRTFRSASVLMPLFEKNGEAHVLAILKSDNRGYPWRNQVALPGGHVDDADENSLATAYREAEEELNINPSDLELVGSLGHFLTIRNTEIEAFVAFWTGERSKLIRDPAEISKIIDLPLRMLTETHIACRFEDRIPDMSELIYPFGDEHVVIWGVTARIIHFFIEHLLSHASGRWDSGLRCVQ